tara:strand:- start:4678 stop:5580 length:903 start_codon:yes stop_codon:yes gene_type:complete
MAGSTYNPIDVNDDTILRVSKSSFVTYAKCPRQFWWQKVALPDLRTPSSPEAIRGTNIHQVMEDGLNEINALNNPTSDTLRDGCFDVQAQEQGVGGDDGVTAMQELLCAIASDWGELEIVELENKHEVRTDIWYTEDDGDGNLLHHAYTVMLVGMIDGVFRHPDGHLVVVELKTGSCNDGKMSRTRRELCYYRKLLGLKAYEEPTHFLTIYPDADNLDFLMKMQNKKNVDIWMGLEKGMAVYEKAGTRSINSMEKALSKSVHGMMTQEFPMKWNEFFCSQWCNFHLSCNEELIGGESDVL